MKFAWAFVLLLTVACSNGRNNDGKNLPPFQRLSSGEWVSECLRTNNAAITARENMTLRGSDGTTTTSFYQNNDCSGAPVRNDGPTNFTYSSTPKAGGPEGAATVTLNYPNRQPVNVEVIVLGDSMTITMANGISIKYTRTGGNAPINRGPQQNAFDVAARGTWMTARCALKGNGTGSYLQILTIRGSGYADTVYNVYNTSDCRGPYTPQQQTSLTYAVIRFANGQGQLNLSGQTIDVTIQDNHLTIRSATGSLDFDRVR